MPGSLQLNTVKMEERIEQAFVGICPGAEFSLGTGMMNNNELETTSAFQNHK